jgi:KDO2-lipid IV(A) lauroyltransferase
VIGALAAALLRVPYPAQAFACRHVVRPLLQLALGRRAQHNLALAFGDQLSQERKREIIAAMFRGLAMLPAEWARFYHQGTALLDAEVDDADARRVMREFEDSWPGGWVAVTGHVGNWELGGQWMKHASSRPMGGIVAKRQPNPHLNRIIEEMRGRHGMPTLYRDGSPTQVVRLLRSGHCIGVAGDQDVESLPGVFVDFLGRPAYTPIGPARLAYTAGVPLMVGVLRRENGRPYLQLNRPIFPDRSRPKQEEVVRLTREWSRQIEEIIRAHPEQWPWFHNRWKTTPELLAQKRRRRSEGDELLDPSAGESSERDSA